jgi:6-phosphogluconolactonase/glucosamine-6-phosphate isomerase/deaminase
MMQVYKVGIADIALAPLARKLKSSLNIGPTLWLLSGGSNIRLSVEIMKQIDTNLSAGLSLALVDERFGPYRHPDSNWTQLLQSGFDPKQARVIETIRPDSGDLAETINRYSEDLSAAIEESTSVIGQLGMGTDGHIGGILPGSPAAIETDQLVLGYQSNPYTRITMSFNGLRQLDCAFLLAFGQDKQSQLSKLVNQDVSLDEQPAQIIKQIQESYLYNDQVEGKK